ncbi:CapA family protein [Clostridium sp. MB40-C1]|uniref:CapA family protein n=1 Tax=Clostridium sp. MB40-C1 TaxID=3070996 RepID=UPI0027DF9695|nr:CapA family protein [Clostridium sp. MB40-C1]WMJ80810.1 CapA family protein [Clostridium sp. MB40-C1]
MNSKHKRKRIKIKDKHRFISISILLLTLVVTTYLGIKNSNSKHKTSSSSPKITKSQNVDPPLSSKPTSSKASVEKLEDKPVQNTNASILLTSVGDCTLGRDDKYSYEGSLPHILKKNNNDYSYIFKNVYDIFKNDDITTANLEGTFTDSTQKATKSFNFKAPSEYANILTKGSIEGVNLSNNHIYDYLEKGFEDTKKALKDANIPFFGEGNVWKTEIKGIKLAFLGYRGFYSSATFLNKVSQDIKSLKKDNYTVIINFHWGQEGSYYPVESQKKIAHHAIDNGADLVIGHHPHVVQGIEKYKDKIICYSLGNFAFGGNKNPSDKNTIIVQTKFNFSNNHLSSYDFKIIPCSISSVDYTNDYCPTPLKNDKRNSLLKKLNKISYNLDFKIDGEFHNIKLKN